jgi:hypothetical protein
MGEAEAPDRADYPTTTEAPTKPRSLPTHPRTRAPAIPMELVPTQTGDDSWTRGDWVNEVESKLGEAFIVYAKMRLAEHNGPKRLAKGWTTEFERTLHVGMIGVAIHPVKRNFDRKIAFEAAVAEMSKDMIPTLGAHVEREYAKAVGGVRCGLDGDDIEMFCRATRDAAAVILGGA